jgi:hypothetical protein
MLVIFGIAWSLSARGWGYAGYGTRRSDTGSYYGHRGPSFFYFGGARYYPTSSARRGSLGGPGAGGLGPGAGK